ncbi:MAG TPA: hypothetical protein DEA44_09575 [Firmicutes bacterium]|nr:hypothetical protein [Bacillota bacterium]
MAALLNSKLLPPYMGTKLLKRPRLLDSIAGVKPLKAAFLIAPAGYGKTALLVQLAEAINKPFVWYQLGDADNDPAVFCQYLAAGIQRHLPSFGKIIPQMAAKYYSPTHLRLLSTAFINGLEAWSEGGLIVLDDYHMINEPLVHSFLRELLYYLPAGIHLMVAGRTPPPLPLSQLELRGEACVIGADQLRFTREEIGAWWQETHAEIPVGVLEALEQKTAGWAAALRLAGDMPANITKGLPINTSKIYDYLAVEVLDRQPKATQDFLLATAILEEFTADFCDLLLGRTDCRQIITSLERQQLFLIPLEDGQTYRYHQLFRDFLRNYSGTGRRTLLHRAGVLSAKAGKWENAFAYLSAAEAHEELLAVFKEASQHAFRQGKWQTVARWLESITPAQLAADPWVKLYKATVEVHRGRLSEAEHWLNNAIAVFVAKEETAGLAESRLLQARLARCRGHYAQSLQLLEQATTYMTEQEKADRFDLSMEKAFCLYINGNFKEAEVLLTAALAMAKRNNNRYGMSHLLEALGNVYVSLGKYLPALQAFQKGQEISPERFLPGCYTQDLICLIYHDWGESDQALEYAKRNAAIKENLGLVETLPAAYQQLGNIYADRSEWSLAEHYFQRSIGLIKEHNGEGFHLALSLIFWAECLSLQGRWVEARAKAEEALAAAEQQPGIAWHICRDVAALIFMQTGSTREGKEFLSSAITAYEQLGFQRGLGHAYTFQAWIYFSEENLTKACEYAEKSLAVAAKLNFRQIFLKRYDLLKPILKLGLERGKEVVFVQGILVRLGERALSLLRELAAHADPAVRLRTIAPLAEIGSPAAEELIKNLKGDPDREVSQMADLANRRLQLVITPGTAPGVDTAPLYAVTFGAFRVSCSGTVDSKENWRTMKTRDLLAYFMHYQVPLNKERILEDLWPDSDHEHATISFHTTLHYLRRFLESGGHKDMIVYKGKRYQLKPGGFHTDREQFQDLLTASLRMDTAPDQVVDCLEQAVNLYHGSYLDEMEYPWLLPVRENLKNACITARLRLSRHYMQTRDFTRAITHLRATEALDPFAEEVHSLIMTAYAKLGNRTAVDKQYRNMMSIFKKELDLLPSQTINDLYRTLIK